jgi:hypothetical protein
MSMLQLVIGTACGFLFAQAVLYAFGRLIGWLPHSDVLARLRTLRAPGIPRLPRLPVPTVLSAFIKYAAPVGVSVALATLCVWAISDYLAGRSAHNAEASLFDSTGAASGATPGVAKADSAALAPPPAAEPAAEAVGAVDPYTDPEFKVQRKGHHAGDALREALLQKSEARARGELLHELQQHARRSQYDCEAAARADRYLKAGLDVWGFASWQVKYFPADGYHGATLEQCRDIKSVVASSVDLESAVAQQNPDDSEQR